MTTYTATFANVVRRSPRRVCRSIWAVLPASIVHTEFMNRTGRFIYRRFTRDTIRVQSHYTQFMRNPPLLDAIASLLSTYGKGAALRVASIGCSTGAELYSALYVLRRARPDLVIAGTGVDISDAVVEVARRGVYKPGCSAALGGLYLEGRPEVLREEVADLGGILEVLEDGLLRVHDGIRDKTHWTTGDASDPLLFEELQEQDVVLANNVMGPMQDALAEACLRNIMHLVRPGGYLIIDGIDLDLKTRVMMSSSFEPVPVLREEIWNADKLKSGWPWLRWGREPLDIREPTCDWRYSIIFKRLNGG
jgi:chemotaxis methyl-accepting protein methylase